ncbi:GNAT family N-acetyltransferase [Actinoplanes rectilineatus]|uniref:GNAT family N-acetyltransferase n=1 Tax=Actinoplanes rectilineatus TaxID=113571 RepID=UPI0005F2A7EF|nr:GNAT family N-acetyltransferase [Actinoplanes rectilineatus]
MSFDIEVLTIDDLAGCLALAQDREWRPEERRWRLLFELGTVFGVRDDDGRLAGTTVLTAFGTALSAISMVLVASEHGGRGLGRRLMEHALAAARTDDVMLYATAYGQPLYEKLGFTAGEPLHVHLGELSVPPTSRTRPAVPADLAAVTALDRATTGAPRDRLVRWLFDSAERLRVLERDGVIVGYGAAWNNLDQLMVAPVVAENDQDAKALIGELTADADRPVRVDLREAAAALREWVEHGGAARVLTSTTMVQGGRTLPGDRSRWVVPATQALG